MLRQPICHQLSLGLCSQASTPAGCALQVANSCKGVRECLKVCQHADGAQPLTCDQDDEVDADEIKCGLCDVRESTDVSCMLHL